MKNGRSNSWPRAEMGRRRDQKWKFVRKVAKLNLCSKNYENWNSDSNRDIVKHIKGLFHCLL